MDFMWSFFEDLDEMVYVSDIDSHTLVYMNAHLRRTLGYESPDEYVGKECYKVLQESPMPCSFCTNHALKPGKFLSWTYKNPVINRRFLVKDSMICVDDRRYRIEIAIDLDAEDMEQATYYYAHGSSILTACLHKVFSTTNPENALDNMLSYIGETFLCARAYIFEIDDIGRMRNTYEWCAPGVVAQKDILQDESCESISSWMQEFEQNNVVLVRDREEIAQKYPSAYVFLKSLDISTFVAGPITTAGRVTGFLGVDEPNEQMLNLITPLLSVIGYSVSSLLRRRDLIRRLHELSYRDQLTGALNRNALAEYYEKLPMQSVGVIYCDITGLKRVNDSIGHQAGDLMICHCYNLIRENLDTDLIYRTGGDEFIALCPDCTKEDFKQSVRKLRRKILQDEYHIAVGYAWSDQQPLHLETLTSRADEVMYEDKRDYYAQSYIVTAAGSRHPTHASHSDKSFHSDFQRFLSATYCNIESLFQSIAQDNSSSYFYFGDMQKDLFYISDNMREDFGFESNVVPGLLRAWARHISTPEFQNMFVQDIMDMLQTKRTSHNLRYQVRDIHGNNKWIRCYGILKWNEDKTIPLFFSGRITHQDNDFLIDPVTNLPREYAVFTSLQELRKSGKHAVIIGFSLNNITEINNTRGRAYADHLLKNIADQLMEQLSWKMSFHRLEGMRCIAIVDPDCTEPQKDLVRQIRDIVQSCYLEMGISVRHPCSFGVMEYPCDSLEPEDIVENMVALIKVARHDTKQLYVDYSLQNIKQIKQIANMALALNQDVLHGMEHFRIVIQPVVSAKDGKIIGGETLLRWTFQDKDIPPSVFIPILEKENMMHIVGRWVFEKAVSSCLRCIAYDPDFYLTFNVSLHQLSDTQFVDFMHETLHKYRLRGTHLVAELTESCLDEQPEKLTGFVECCNQMGMRVALDDFGSGYSSLRMLLQYPSSIIKLDRSLLQEITKSDEKMHFIRSIVYACHQFGKQVCMEGVERKDQNDILLSTGCDMIQGFYYYRPMELPALYRLLSEHIPSYSPQ
ncbi:MAG: EAL domain-containing protein [Butyricicoccus sp.]|nr:EAL domain-containing protein [Butyricicoccus sp.]